MPLRSKNLYSFEDACAKRQILKTQNKTVVLTNGCFDLLHSGHIYSLEQAANLGDSLWIALNSDSSIKELKDHCRPIINERERAYMLSALEYIDGIFIFSSTHLDKQILKFQPDVYAKAGDYSLNTLDKDELFALQTVKSDIKFLKFLNGFSTTELIKKIKNI